jgi:heptose-I-phosphate ethanolaminephosphotransferase
MTDESAAKSGLSKNYQITLLLTFLIFLSIAPSFLISFKAVVRSLYPLILLAALVNNRRVFIVLMIPVLIMMPAAVHFWMVYHAPMNATFWLIVFGTNIAEMSDFLQNLWVIIIPAFFALCFLIFWIWKKAKGNFYVSKKWRLATFLLLGIPLFALGRGIANNNIRNEITHHFTESYPWNFLMGYIAAEGEIASYQKVDFVHQWNLQSKVDVNVADKPEVIVLVIGESARRDHHEVYGYKVPTTPEMAHLHDAGSLLLFQDLITLHPHTADSVPTIMTKQDNIHEITEIPPSFIQVYKDAGFKTYWISNQAAMGGNENRISVYARKSDYFHSLHISSINLPWAYDGELIPDFLDKLKEPAPKKLIVLHLQGSHYGFDKRYPKEFARFKEQYDNTILYTDYLLGQVVKALAKTHSVSAMMYLSDHGLMLGECGQYTHFDMKQSYEIPFWIWVSPEWRSLYPQKFTNTLKNADKKLSTLFVLDSLVDLGGLTYNGFESDKSVLSPSLKEIFPRNVKTYSQIIDYDHGHNDPQCHLIAN